MHGRRPLYINITQLRSVSRSTQMSRILHRSLLSKKRSISTATTATRASMTLRLDMVTCDCEDLPELNIYMQVSVFVLFSRVSYVVSRKSIRYPYSKAITHPSILTGLDVSQPRLSDAKAVGNVDIHVHAITLLYASLRNTSPHLCNQLPVSFRQPCTKHPADDVTLSNSPPTCSPLSPSITHSLFHSRLKTHLFHKSFPP